MKHNLKTHADIGNSSRLDNTEYLFANATVTTDNTKKTDDLTDVVYVEDYEIQPEDF